MKKVKVKNLKDAALDWAVAMAKGRPGLAQMILLRPGTYTYRPSTNWGDAGPIIEEYEIELFQTWEPFEIWQARMVHRMSYSANTQLIAAMLTFVASSSLTDSDYEIEVPEALV